MQNLSILQAQVDSLKEMIEIMEKTNPDILAKKWRAKVFEELVRNKQQQIMHSIEIKRFKDDEKKLRSREQQIKAALESAHLQASSLSLERAKLQKEIQNLQLKARNNSIHSSFMLSLQSTFTSNLEMHAKVLAMLDTFNHRVAFSMSKIKTAKILHTREIFALRNRVNEEVTEQKKLREEVSKARRVEIEKENANSENFRLNQELNAITQQFRTAEKQARVILEDSVGKYKECVNQLETQIDEKVSENCILLQRVQELTKEAENLFNENIEIKQRFENQDQETQRLGILNEELNANYDKVKSDLQRTKEDLTEKSESLVRIKEEYAKCQQELKTSSSELISIIKEKDKSHEEAVKKFHELAEEDRLEIEYLKGKVTKLEVMMRDFRRERDILFENVKKSTRCLKDDKEIQTDSGVTHGTIKKTAASKGTRVEELKSLGKEMLEL